MRVYAPTLKALGFVIMIFGALMCVPLFVSLWLNDGAAPSYYTGIFITFIVGILISSLTWRQKRDLRVHDGFLLVAATWIILPVFGSLPLISYIPDLSFTKGYFEASSGLSATGATVLVGLDSLPQSINLWRTFMHWIGGMGVIVLVVAILPLLGIGGRQLYKTEVPTPMKENSLTPRITETAKGLWLTYSLLTIGCGTCLWLAGMDGWDAVIHAFSVIGLGGFSSKDASLGHYNSVGIEITVVVFALASALNFSTHYLALSRGSIKPYLRDPEIPFFFGVFFFSVILLTGYLSVFHTYDSILTTLRHVIFNIASIATSLGLAIHDYTDWPMFPQLWILFMGSFFACSGSTGGGMKMMRAVLLYKQVLREIIRALHPHAIRPVHLGNQVIPENILQAILGFSFIYMVTIVSLTLLMCASGLDIITAFSGVVACLNNTGPGLGEVGPASNYAGLNDFQIWVLSFTMILGRLEIFTLLVVMTPQFWRR